MAKKRISEWMKEFYAMFGDDEVDGVVFVRLYSERVDLENERESMRPVLNSSLSIEDTHEMLSWILKSYVENSMVTIPVKGNA